MHRNPEDTPKCICCGEDLNLIEGGQENFYAWETAECLRCNLDVLLHYGENETIVTITSKGENK